VIKLFLRDFITQEVLTVAGGGGVVAQRERTSGCVQKGGSVGKSPKGKNQVRIIGKPKYSCKQSKRSGVGKTKTSSMSSEKESKRGKQKHMGTKR